MLGHTPPAYVCHTIGFSTTSLVTRPMVGKGFTNCTYQLMLQHRVQCVTEAPHKRATVLTRPVGVALLITSRKFFQVQFSFWAKMSVALLHAMHSMLLEMQSLVVR